MVKKSLHEILHLIKTAQVDMGEPPSSNTRVKPVVDQSLKQYRGAPSTVKPKEKPMPTNNIGKMQRAILDFASVVQSTDTTSFESGKQRDRGQELAPVPISGIGGDNSKMTSSEQEKLFGTDAMGDFLMNHYIKSPGKQYANVDMTEEEGRDVVGRGAVDATNLRGLIETIKRIGTPKPSSDEKPKPGQKQPKFVGRGEHVEDGIWDDRTNNALHNIAALIGAVLSFSKDMGQTVKGYTLNDLNQFKGGLPANDNELNSKEKEMFAAALTQHIKAMTQFYKNFKQQVMENKKYQNFITQNASFGKINSKSEKKPEDSDNMIYWITKEKIGVDASQEYINKARAYYESYKDQSANPVYFGVQAKYNDITMKFGYSDLANADAFKEKVKSYLGRVPTKDELQDVVNTIRESMKTPASAPVTQKSNQPVTEKDLKQKEWQEKQDLDKDIYERRLKEKQETEAHKEETKFQRNPISEFFLGKK